MISKTLKGLTKLLGIVVLPVTIGVASALCITKMALEEYKYNGQTLVHAQYLSKFGGLIEFDRGRNFELISEQLIPFGINTHYTDFDCDGEVDGITINGNHTKRYLERGRDYESFVPEFNNADNKFRKIKAELELSGKR